MSSNAKSQPIIVIKKKGGHGGHHGGAWKVAYADFVTAMMSLFIVLWLMGSSEKVKKAVAGYFNDPKGTGSLLGTTMNGTGEAIEKSSTEQLEKLKDKLEQEIKARKELEKLAKQIEITITPEGLRIELLEQKDGTFFQRGSAQLSDNGQKLLALLASELQGLPNTLLIEGHTDSVQYSTDTNYSNWELSADRANAARRVLQQEGVRTGQVTQVRGYADQLPREHVDASDPSNRRVSILVKNTDQQAQPPTITAQKAIAQGVIKKAAAKPTDAPSAKPETAAKPGAAPPKPEVPAKSEKSSAKAEAPARPAAPPKPEPATNSTPKPAAAKPSLFDRVKQLLPGKKK